MMIQLPKADSECFPSPDMEQVVIGIIGLSSRFRCQLKCNCYTSLIDLNNLFNEFIYILLVMIYNVLAIILQKRVQIKLNNCASVSKSCSISTAKRVTVGSFLINGKKKNPINNSKHSTNFEINHYKGGKNLRKSSAKTQQITE